MSRPAYRRLDVDERRQQLLERGAELFTTHPYDELSMSKIAAEVGISKALLYHYFPSKQAYFEATLSAWAATVSAGLTAADVGRKPASTTKRFGWSKARQ